MFSFLERSKADKMYPEPVQIPFLVRLLQPSPAAVFMIFLVLKNIFQQRFVSLCWRKAAGRWLLWEALPRTQCTHCRPSFCTLGDKSETPVNTIFYRFSFHSCSPSPVAWILWEHRAPKSSSLHCSSNTIPSFLLCKGNRTREAILAADSRLAVGGGVTFTGRDSMLCLCGSLCRTVLCSIDKNMYPRVYFRL